MGRYQLLEKRDVKSKTGHAGVQFRFGHDEGCAPHLYTLSLFVTPEHPESEILACAERHRADIRSPGSADLPEHRQ
jgi:hypothetical protein